MAELDRIIHEPARLRIMAALAALDHGEQMDFVRLRDVLGLTDGNLGAHLARLEEARYVRIEKAFVNRKPRKAEHGKRISRQATADFLRHFVDGYFLGRKVNS